MVEKLFNLLDSLVEKERIIKNILDKLGGEQNRGFLDDEIEQLEYLIVKAIGGNEGHYNHINSIDLFYKYEYCDISDAKEELIEYIKLTIENDWTEDVGIIFKKA